MKPKFNMGDAVVMKRMVDEVGDFMPEKDWDTFYAGLIRNKIEFIITNIGPDKDIRSYGVKSKDGITTEDFYETEMELFKVEDWRSVINGN